MISLITIKNMIYSVLKYYFKLIFNHNQITKTYFISTPSFFSKITNNFHFLETELYGNDLRMNLKDSLHQYDHKFLEKGYKFSDNDEMNISTINVTQYITYEYYIHQPMLSIQRRINIILAKNPHRSNIHPLIRRYSHIPFNN